MTIHSPVSLPENPSQSPWPLLLYIPLLFRLITALPLTPFLSSVRLNTTIVVVVFFFFILQQPLLSASLLPQVCSNNLFSFPLVQNNRFRFFFWSLLMDCRFHSRSEIFGFWHSLIWIRFSSDYNGRLLVSIFFSSLRFGLGLF